MKTLLKIVSYFFIAVFVVLGLCVGFLETAPGKRMLAQFVEGQASRFINGSLSIGSIHGNLFSRISIKDVVLKDREDRVVAKVAVLSSRHRIHRLRPFQFFFDEIRVEQPRVYRHHLKNGQTNWDTLLKQSDKSEEKQNGESQGPAVWLARVEVVEATFEESGDTREPIVVHHAEAILEMPERLNRLPEGGVALRGKIGRTPVRADLWVGPQVPSRATLSAIRKSTGATDRTVSDPQSLRLVAAYGNLRAHVDLDGHVNLEESNKSDGEIRIDADNAGRTRLEMRAGFESLPRPTVVDLRAFEFSGECPYLVLEKPSRLAIPSTGFIPQGELSLSGCAGAVQFSHEAIGKRLAASARNLQIGSLIAAILPSEAKPPRKEDDLGIFNLDVEFPRGIEARRARILGNWSVPEAIIPTKTTMQLKAGLRGKRLWANVDATVGKTPLELRARAHGDVLGDLSDFTSVITGCVKGYDIPMQSGLQVPPVWLDAHLNYTGKAATLAASALAQGIDEPVRVEASVKLPGRTLVDDLNGLMNSVYEARLYTQKFPVHRIVKGAASGRRLPRVWSSLDVSAKGRGQDFSGGGEIRIASRRGDLAHLSGTYENEKLSARLQSQAAEIDPLFRLVSDRVSARGATLNADLHFDLTRDKIAPRGFVEANVKELLLTVQDLGYQNGHLKITAEPGAIRLDDLSARTGDGKIQATGQLDIDEKTAKPLTARFKAIFDDFEGISYQGFRLKADADATGSMDFAVPKFAINVDVDRAEITMPKMSFKNTLEPTSDLEDVVTLQEIEERKQAPAAQGMLAGLTGTIGIHAPKRVRVVGDMLDLDLKANLEAGLNKESKFYMTGEVESLRGRVELFGRRLEVSKAVVAFLGDPAEPRIEAIARYDADPRDIIVSVTGSPEELRPRLGSDPAGYSEDQALGVLLTGSPDYQKTGEGAGAGSVAGTAAANLLVQQMKDLVGKKLPVDTIDAGVTTGDTASSDQGPLVNLEVGKYISDRAFLKLGRVYSVDENAPVNRISLDYRLFRRWSLRATQTDSGTSNFGVTWTLQY